MQRLVFPTPDGPRRRKVGRLEWADERKMTKWRRRGMSAISRVATMRVGVDGANIESRIDSMFAEV